MAPPFPNLHSVLVKPTSYGYRDSFNPQINRRIFWANKIHTFQTPSLSKLSWNLEWSFLWPMQCATCNPGGSGYRVEIEAASLIICKETITWHETTKTVAPKVWAGIIAFYPFTISINVWSWQKLQSGNELVAKEPEPLAFSIGDLKGQQFIKI
jgi:hypothetical protein